MPLRSESQSSKRGLFVSMPNENAIVRRQNSLFITNQSITKNSISFAIAGLRGDKVIIEVIVEPAERRPIVGRFIPALEHHLVVGVGALEYAVVWLGHAESALHLVQHLASRHT